MKRRTFLKTSGKIAVGSLLLNGVPVRGLAQSSNFTCQEIQDRVYVMVNLFGANDTLNTVIPVQQYSIYANNRPNIRIPDSGPNAYINLDNTLPSNQLTGLHPIMTEFKSLYDSGKMNIVHGVGYLNNNRSHFKSDDLWNTAGDSTPANFNFGSGWAGQMFEYRYPNLLGNPTTQMPDPPCIELGSTSGSLLFQTSTNNNSSILLTSTNVSSFYNTLVSVGGPGPENFPSTDFGDELRYIDEVQRISNVYALRIQTVFNAGTNSTVVYPNTNIARQLKTVARLIRGGSKSSMYTVHQYGYDTHGNQAVVGDPTTGTHANLLRDLGQALKAFQDDIAAMGFEDRVITTTHSEFGRTIDENSGFGTDHGGVSTMFIIGKGVKPGVTGNPIDLTKVNSRGLTDLQYDYRRVWAAILQDFMGHGGGPMQVARMDGYTSSKAPIIATTHIAPSSCYINQIIVVPVTLVNFNAKLLNNGNAEVFWETSFENDSKEFEVQHSINGKDWNSIGRVDASGYSSTNKSYRLNHPKPETGKNFYRLWQVDLNGSRKLYGPVVLNVRAAIGFTVKNYPNPAKFDFNIAITTDKSQKANIQFYDVQGHLLNQQNISLQKGFNKFNYMTTQLNGYKGQLIIHIVTELGVQQTLRQVIE